MREMIQFFMNGASVTRYHTVTTIQRESVGHHSHGVALICYILDPECYKYVLLAALLHDLAEHQTGDIPSPAKREYGIGEQVDQLESKLLNCAGLSLPIMTKEEMRTLKIADIAQGALFCAKEIALGNKSMRIIFDRYIGYAEGMALAGRERELFNIIKEQV